MAYLEPHFDPDVFVSYSHGDPRGVGDSPLKTWTHALLRKLESQILSLDTEYDELHVWMDEQIDPTAHLTDELRDQSRRVGRPDHRDVEALPRFELVPRRARVVP